MNARLVKSVKALAPIVAIAVVQPLSAQSEPEEEAVVYPPLDGTKPAREYAPPPSPPVEETQPELANVPPPRRAPPPAPPAIRLPPPAPPPARVLPPPAPPSANKRVRPINSYQWFHNVVMPADLYRQEAAGFVEYQLEVDKSGKPTMCTTTGPTEFPALNILTCDTLMTKARFRPATDKDGSAVASTFEGFHNWSHKPHDLNDFDITITMVVDENGAQTACEVIEQTGIMPQGFNGESPCQGLVRGQGPWRDENGEPQARELTFKVSIVGAEPPAVEE